MRREKVSDENRILFINDDTKDKTWEIIRDLSKREEHFVGISRAVNEHGKVVMHRRPLRESSISDEQICK